MNIFELFILAIGLSMDAFAVSVCKGLSLGRINAKHMCIAGVWFGGFQALMPLVGYFGGRFFADKVTRYSHWVAFVLLVFIGAGMNQRIERGRTCKCGYGYKIHVHPCSGYQY